ncbi:hypothetical protein AVEN_83214-1 [Araneus ventricosus]|uniref:Uncharacterized protein n=1 Tax=Araneus ventricosus TaxID=182803 RepID=A0A4Y2AMZ4_ARAVE|nr:hypothetical protein AVEN_83214-1 [Araneus ventricosus]
MWDRFCSNFLPAPVENVKQTGQSLRVLHCSEVRGMFAVPICYQSCFRTSDEGAVSDNPVGNKNRLCAPSLAEKKSPEI